MSRVGNNPIKLPKNVKFSVEGSNVLLEGPKGKLAVKLPQGIRVDSKEEQLFVTRASDIKQNRANHGTIRARLVNMVAGVTEGHTKELEIQGIGFRANMKGNKIVFNLGLSHPVEFEVPQYVKATVADQTSIKLEGSDNQLVGQVAAKIRDLKPVEPYKGKGIRYVGENVRRKQGKSAAK